MSLHRTVPLLRLIATHSCRARNSQSHRQILISRPQLLSSTEGLRRFATTAPEPGTGRAEALLVKQPDPQALDPEDEVELLEDSEARLQITERAAEKLRSVSSKEGVPSISLRIGVESGGCHGYQYTMELTEEDKPDDYLFSHPTHRPASIVVDAVSLGLLKGSTVDYATELIGSSFRILDNPQAKGSGCGCGVSWEAKF